VPLPGAATPKQAGTPSRRRFVPGLTGWFAAAGPLSTLPSLVVEERYESELTRAATVLDGVDRALERLSEGTYGQCETCGAPILQADLEHDPTRRMCEQHLSLA
jgi:hypothetical protein